MKKGDKVILEQNIDKLIKSIENQTGKDSIQYLELISVEIRANSFFLIAGKGYNREKYLDNLKDHLRDKANTSLLFLNHKKDEEFIFFHKELNHLPVDYIKDKKRTFYSERDRPYSKVQGIDNKEGIIQWDKWVKMAHRSYPGLRHICFLHSSLSVPVSQSSIKITSAIWVFFSKPIPNIREIEPELRTGIYEYIIYTLLPEKVKQIERQDTFDALAHSQKQYIEALTSISSELRGKNKKWLDYVKNSLNGFLAISKSYKERTLSNIKKEEVSLSEIILDIIDLLESLVLSNIRVLDLSIKGNDNRRNKLFEKNKKRKLFTGNFRDISLNKLKLFLYIPQMIFKEAIVNALENADKNNPEVEINYSLGQNGNNCVISISNNGLATEEDVREMVNPQDQFKLGCRLIIDLAEILDWKFGVESNFKNKTTYHFSI